MMGEAYEFDGELFTSAGEFLDAIAHAYKSGDKDLAIQTLEDYGFSASDIHTGTTTPHPISAADDASSEVE